MFVAKRLFILTLVGLLGFSFVAENSVVYGLSEKQRDILNSGIFYYDIDSCAPGQTDESAPKNESEASGDTQELAKQMLNNSNITYWTNNGVNTRDAVLALSEGKKAATTAPDGQQRESTVNPNILKFILDAAKEGKIMVNALTDKDHSTNSNHYKGMAVDLDNNPGNTSVPVSKLIEIAKKYGGTKNSESTHHHFDFVQGSGGTTEGDEDVASSLYMVGDSISVGAKADLIREFKAKSITAYVNGSVSRSITGKGTTSGFKTSGLQAVQDDRERIKSADIVVVELGTNQNPDFEGSIKDLIEKIKSYNGEASIYWVEAFSEGKVDSAKINESINKLAKSEGYTAIKTTGKSIQLSGDKIHPTSEGAKTFAEVIAGSIQPSDTNAPTPKQSAGCTCGGDKETSRSTPLKGGDVPEKIFNFFVSKGLKPYQAAGIMGNMKAESGLNPRALEPGTTGDAPISGRGYGLVQWTFPPRQNPLIDAAKKAGKPVSDLGVQLQYVMDELDGKIPGNSWKKAGDNLRKTKDVKEATLVVELQYEIHAGGVQPQREADARTYLGLYGSGTGGGADSPSDTLACETESEDGSGEIIGEYSLPLQKKWYDQQKGWFTKPHHDYPASDIPVPTGTTVYSMTPGKIVKAPVGGACGLGVLIVSDSGAEYIYCHGTDGGTVKNAKQGDKVTAGQKIMTSGNTGRSSGPHLHVQIKVKGALKCPQSLFTSIVDGSPKSETALPASGCTN